MKRRSTGPDWIERRRKPRTATEERQPYQRRSLYAEILDFMFAPMALLWPLSVVLTFVVARSLADVPFDRELEQRIRALTNYVEITGSFEPPQSFDVPRGLLTDRGRGAHHLPDRLGLAARSWPAIRPCRGRGSTTTRKSTRSSRRTLSHRSEDWRVAYAYVAKRRFRPAPRKPRRS